MNCSETTRRATQKAKQNQWFRRMFTVALLMGLVIGGLLVKLPDWISRPEPLPPRRFCMGPIPAKLSKFRVMEPLFRPVILPL